MRFIIFLHLNSCRSSVGGGPHPRWARTAHFAQYRRRRPPTKIKDFKNTIYNYKFELEGMARDRKDLIEPGVRGGTVMAGMAVFPTIGFPHQCLV